MRETIFISHANPEENEFTKWLGLQLSCQGYSVWSDVTKLIGGESFWADIEAAIRDQTVRFVFVLSQASLTKKGAQDELALATIVAKQLGIKDFIIPVRVDDVPYGDVNIQMIQLNVINFSGNWASGLATLMKKLTEDGVPRDEGRFNASTIRSWWEANQVGQGIIQEEREELISNWIPLPDLPHLVHLHETSQQKSRGRTGRRGAETARKPYPVHSIGRTIVSFATADELGLEGAASQAIVTREALDGTSRHLSIKPGQLSNAIVRLLRLAWNSAISSTGLPAYPMANDTLCHYFTTKVVGQGEQIKFESAAGSGRRAFLGKFKGHVWHYGVSGDVRLDTFPRIVLYAHVLASSDGLNLWASKPRLQAARQSACRGWWNPEWRDRQLAFLSWLSGKMGGRFVSLNLSPSITLKVALEPAVFHSPVGFDEDSINGGFEELDDSTDLDIENLLSGDSEAS